MPKIYKRHYCIRCGVTQRLYKVKLLCDECRIQKEKFTDYYYDYYTGEKRDFTIRFN
jgi:ribosomal protein S26